MRRTSGFTLIELLLVLAIIGIISAIAVPAMLGQRDRARATAVKDQAFNVVGDLASVLTDLGEPPSERRTGYPTTAYPATPVGYQAKAQDAISIVLAKVNFASARNPYTGAVGAYQSNVTPAAGAGTLGQVYLDAATANNAESSVLTVTGVFQDPKGTVQHLTKTISVN